MASYNKILLLGNIGSVEVKTFQNGGKVVEATLATSRRYKDRNGDQHEDTQWHRLVISGPQADTAEKFITKGDPLFCTGEMRYRKYTTRDGVEKSVPEVQVDTFQLLPKGQKEGPAYNAVAGTRPASPAPAPAPAPEVAGNPDEDLPF